MYVYLYNWWKKIMIIIYTIVKFKQSSEKSTKYFKINRKIIYKYIVLKKLHLHVYKGL